MVETENEENLIGYEVVDSREEKHKLIFHIMKGVVEPYTMKIQGSIASLPVLALIDSEASHNLLSKEVTKKLAISGGKTSSF